MQHMYHARCMLLAVFLLVFLSLCASAPSPPSSSSSPPGGSVIWSSSRRAALRSRVEEMFDHGFTNYMTHAFPHDEIKPVSKTWTDSLAELGNARASEPALNNNRKTTRGGRTYQGVALTMIDSLSTLAVLGRASDFCAGVDWLIRSIPNFEFDLRVHMFESNIRMLGGILSSHLLLTDGVIGRRLTDGVEFRSLVRSDLGSLRRLKYRNELLHLARDLGERLYQAFIIQRQSHEKTKARGESSPIPYAFVHLTDGILDGETEETCTACVGTLSIEFGVLSMLTGDMKYKYAADEAMQAIFELRSPLTDLLPNTFDRRDGKIHDPISTIGSGIDSIYEYLLKSYILFDDQRNLDMFQRLYQAVELHLKLNVEYDAASSPSSPSSSSHPRTLSHLPPPSLLQSPSHVSHAWYVESNMFTGSHVHLQHNSLGSFWSTLQVLSGRILEGRETHASIDEIWKQFHALPERFYVLTAQVHSTERHYSLRPEFIESTYYLYRATRDTLYLDTAERIINDLNTYCRVEGGFAGLSSVESNGGTGHHHIDRTESFFFAETLKYLYLLFADDEHWLHQSHTPSSPASRVGVDGATRSSSPSPSSSASSWIFSTEGHPFPVRDDWQRRGSDQEVRDMFTDVATEPSTPHSPDRDDLIFQSQHESSIRHELEVWSTIHRAQQRSRLVGDIQFQQELSQAGENLNPILREWRQHISELTHQPIDLVAFTQPPSLPSASASSSHGVVTRPKPHRWSHLFRSNQGFFHHPLVTRGIDPHEYDRRYKYHLRRFIGEQDGFGIRERMNVGSPGLLDPSLSNPPGTLYTGAIDRTFERPISVAGALRTPRHGGAFGTAPNGRTCGIPTHMWLANTPPKHFLQYDRDWRRYQAKAILDRQRQHEYQQWHIQRALRQVQKQVATATAAAAAAAGAANTDSLPPSSSRVDDPTPTQQYINLNGKNIPLPSSVADMIALIQQQQQQHPQQQQGVHPSDAGFSTLSYDSSHGSILGSSDGIDSINPDFSVEHEMGAFHIIHHPTGSSLTMRNLGSPLVELVNEVELEAHPSAGGVGGGGIGHSAAPDPHQSSILLRVGMATMSDDGEIQSYAVRLSVPNVCEGSLPASGAHFGRAPPVASHAATASAAQQDQFLQMEIPDTMDPLATLDSMMPAGPNDDGLLRAYLVRAHPAFACSALSPSAAADVRGRIVLIERGGCTFVEKSLHLQSAGAIGAIVWNRSQPNYLFVMGTDETGRNVRFPIVMIDDHAGRWLSRCIAKNEKSFETESRLREVAIRAGQNVVPTNFERLLSVDIVKRSHRSGSMIQVPPFPTFKPFGPSADTTNVQADAHLTQQRPATMTVTGSMKAFKVMTQAGWSAEVTFEEKDATYVLKLHP